MEDDFVYETALDLWASRSLSDVMSVVFRRVRDLVPTDEVLLSLFDPPSRSLRMVAFAKSDRIELLFDEPVVVPIAPHAAAQLLSTSEPSVWRNDEPVQASGFGDPPSANSVSGSSLLVVRLHLPRRGVAALMLRALGRRRHTPEHERLVSTLERPLSLAVEDALERREQLASVDRLRGENHVLGQRLARQSLGTDLVGAAGGLANVLARLQALASTSRALLLTGEVGVGKEALAAAYHGMSTNRQGTFVKVDCASLTPDTAESALFGIEEPSFVGTASHRVGALELANRGTLYLEQVDRLAPELLGKVLGCLQEGALRRHEGSDAQKFETRLVASSHSTLEEMIETGAFRPSLWEGIGLVPIRVPPLRERRADIPQLVLRFAEESARQLGRTVPSLSPDAVERLKHRDWPGNLRSLRIAVEHAVLSGRFDFSAPDPSGGSATLARSARGSEEDPRGRDLEHIELYCNSNVAVHSAECSAKVGFPALEAAASYGVAHPSPVTRSVRQAVVPLDRVMAAHLEQALLAARGRIEGPDGAAALLGVNPSTLRHRLRKLGIPFGRSR